MAEDGKLVAGIDAGTECVKAILLSDEKVVVGRGVVPTRGHFEERVREAMDIALDEAKVAESDLTASCATGFAAKCVPGTTRTAGETTCHAEGAFHHYPHPMAGVDIGGRDPKVIHIGSDGRASDIHTVRKCAVGIGTFLMFASRHLDVHPTQLQELAAGAERRAQVGSYCSVFAGSEVLERLREGHSREEVALGCMHSVAERVAEIGGFVDPLRVTGGVAEYFPGVLQALGDMTGLKVEAVPEPITVGALGAALKALRA